LGPANHLPSSAQIVSLLFIVTVQIPSARDNNMARGWILIVCAFMDWLHVRLANLSPARRLAPNFLRKGHEMVWIHERI